MASARIPKEEFKYSPRITGIVGSLSERFVEVFLTIASSLTIVLTAVFVAVGVSMTVDPGHFADSSKEEGPDTPASSQMLKDDFTFAASPNPVYLGDKVTFWANASSWDGTELTFTILYDSLLPDGDDE
ncbi:MAG: hypothetical protein JSU93_06830, partial [Methanobacteriota archaeon]